MRHLTPILFTLPVILLFLISGCSETEMEDIGVEPSGVQNVETLTTPPPVETDPEKVFELLKQVFAGRLDNAGNFTALREITASRIYLDYLAAVYPTETPVNSLEEYFQIAPLNPQRYVRFLAELGIDEPTDEDIAVMHHITYVFREINYASAKAAFIPRNPDNPAEDILQIFSRVIAVLEEPVVKAFLERHHLQEGDEFAVLLMAFVGSTLEADAAWVEKQTKIYGTDNGLLWCALQNPALMGEMLGAFDSTDFFLSYLSRVKREEAWIKQV